MEKKFKHIELDDDEIKQIQEGTLKSIEYLNNKNHTASTPCERGTHYISVNEYGCMQCRECYVLFSKQGLRRELSFSHWWSTKAGSRYDDLLKMAILVKKGKVKSIDTIHIGGYRNIEGRGYIVNDRIFYDPD